MNPTLFFRTSEVRHLIGRACRAAAMPVCVHSIQKDGKDRFVLGTDFIQACRYVANLDGGPQACRECRLPMLVEALHGRNPTPFLCCLGFACVAMPALPDPDLPFVLTFGPCCPSEAPETLEVDVRRGLAGLGVAETDPLPFSLSDVSVVPIKAVPKIAEWLAEEVASLWQAVQGESLAEPASAGESAAPEGAKRRGRAKPPVEDPYRARAVAAALATGNRSVARGLVASALSEAPPSKHAGSDPARTRALAVVAATIEAAEAAGMDTTECWARLGAFVSELRQTIEDDRLCAATMKILVALERSTRLEGSIEALARLIRSRLAEPIVLDDLARELVVHPTAITQQLRRKFNMTFRQYVGRLRVDKAKELLRQTGLSVAEIAPRVGVRGASNFGKLFRRFEGISPTEYRSQFGHFHEAAGH